MRVHIEIIKHVKNTVPTHNKHIFVRPKKMCLLWEKCLFGEEKFLFWELEDFGS